MTERQKRGGSILEELLSRRPALKKDPSAQRTYKYEKWGLSVTIQEDNQGGVGGSIWDAVRTRTLSVIKINTFEVC